MLPFACYCYNIFPRSNGTKPPFYLLFGHEPAKGWLTHVHTCSRYYGDNKGKIILAQLYKLWKHHAAYLKEIHNRKDDYTPPNLQITLTLKIGQAVMVRNHAHQTLQPKYLMHYRVLKILKESTLLLITFNGRECKMNINDVKPCTTLELVKNALSSFLNSIKTNHQNHDYNLRPHE